MSNSLNTRSHSLNIGILKEYVQLYTYSLLYTTMSAWIACEKTPTSRLFDAAGSMESTTEKFKANDGKNNDGKENEKRDLKQRSHRLQDWLQDNLKTCKFKKIYIKIPALN